MGYIITLHLFDRLFDGPSILSIYSAGVLTFGLNIGNTSVGIFVYVSRSVPMWATLYTDGWDETEHLSDTLDDKYLRSKSDVVTTLWK